jgi:hypothetical protein
MDVIARRALKRPNVEAQGAGCNPRQLGSCVARGAKWSDDDHDARLGSGESVTELSVTGRYRGGGDEASMEPFAIPPLVNFAHFRKVNNSERAPSDYLALKSVVI